MLRIGCGAGFAGDRVDAAVDLARDGDLDWLVLECLAERTIALGQGRRLRDPEAGFEPRLDAFVRGVLPVLGATRLVSNFGSANPPAAARRVLALADALGVPVDVAVLTGDDVLDRIDPSAPAWEDGLPLEAHGELVSANAYLGTDALLPALATGAQVVVTGRVADPSLFLAPQMAAFGWAPDAWDDLAAGTVVGHLLECGAQVTGGYFADPPRKVVPDLARLGAPLGEVAPDGSVVVTKLPGTGGLVSRATVLEQLTYEITDPYNYLTPDVAVDISGVTLVDEGGDRIAVRGARGNPRPEALKVSVGYRAGFRCEAEIGYAGRTAVARARSAVQVLRERLSGLDALRCDLVGVEALHGPRIAGEAAPHEVVLRVSGTARRRETADAIGEEVFALGVNGPAAGGGFRTRTDEVVGVLSTTVARDAVSPAVEHLRPAVGAAR